MAEFLALCCVFGAANSSEKGMAAVWLFAAVGFCAIAIMGAK